MDLSKAVFDDISQELLIAKLYAYGLSKEAATFFWSYLGQKRAKSKNRQHPKFFASFDLCSTPRIYPQSSPF